MPLRFTRTFRRTLFMTKLKRSQDKVVELPENSHSFPTMTELLLLLNVIPNSIIAFQRHSGKYSIFYLVIKCCLKVHNKMVSVDLSLFQHLAQFEHLIAGALWLISVAHTVAYQSRLSLLFFNNFIWKASVHNVFSN